MSEMPRQNYLGLSILHFFKMKDRKIKQVFSRGGTSGRMEAIRRG
jgi:hypothetical protein